MLPLVHQFESMIEYANALMNDWAGAPTLEYTKTAHSVMSLIFISMLNSNLCILYSQNICAHDQSATEYSFKYVCEEWLII